MSNRTSNLMTAGLFAVGVGFMVSLPLRHTRSLPWSLFGSGALLAVAYVLVAIRRGRGARAAILRVLFAFGVVWAGFAWASWPLTPNRGYLTALSSAVILAPAYLLVAIRPGRGFGMRVFVAVALAILILQGISPDLRYYLSLFSLRRMKLGPRFYVDLVDTYILFPPLAALAVKVLLWRVKRPIPPGVCISCSYDLTGNISGVCPECGTKVANNSHEERSKTA